MASNTDDETNINVSTTPRKPKESLQQRDVLGVIMKDKPDKVFDSDMQGASTEPTWAKVKRFIANIIGFVMDINSRSKVKESTKIQQRDVLGAIIKEKTDKVSNMQGTSSVPKLAKVKRFIASIIGFIKNRTSHSGSDLPKTLESQTPESKHDKIELNQRPQTKFHKTRLSQSLESEHDKTGLSQIPGIENDEHGSEYDKTRFNQRPETERDKSMLNQIPESKHDKTGVNQKPGIEHDYNDLIISKTLMGDVSEKAFTAKFDRTKINQRDVLSVRPKEKPGRKSNSDMQRTSATTNTDTIPGYLKNKTYHRKQYPAVLTNSSRPQALNYHGLVKLRETKSDVQMIEQLCKPNSGFKQMLNTKLSNMDANVIECLLDVLADISSCDNLGSRENIIQVITDVRNSTFLQTHLSQYYMNIMVVRDPLRYLEAINNSLKLFKKLIEVQPSSVREIIIAQTTLERVVITTHETTHFKFPSETIQEVKELQAECEVLISKGDNRCKKKQESFSHKAYYDMVDDDISPPDNFRSVSILPTIDDIKSTERPFLRPNIEVGQYKDLDHYLDVQFRLLKEDFLHPLREGISTYRDMIATGDLKRKLYDIKIYHNVKVWDSVCAFNGINHNIFFDVSKLKNIDWFNTKRLIHGSLLCLSKDNFENVHFATVSNSSPEALEEGILEIQFTHEFADGGLSNYIYVMAESTAFFEAYRHVLKGLQKVGADFPFQKYLIDCIREIDPPKYMLENQNINFNIPFPLERQIKLMDDKSWPTYQELELDMPQYLALKAALRSEMAIIQGPPGTGKTYIGLKIMQCFLKNECLWQSPVDKDRSPILVVCLTNHALDQFLEGILKHMSNEQKLIRVGGRSKNEMLKYNKLGEYRERMRKSNSIPKNYYNSRTEASDEKQHYENKIKNAQWELKQSEEWFMNEDTLNRHISKEHLEALQGQYSEYIYNESGNCIGNYTCSVLLTWLGFGDLNVRYINVSHDNSYTYTSGNESENKSIDTEDDVRSECDDEEHTVEDDHFADNEATIEKNNRTLDLYNKASDDWRKTQRKIINEDVDTRVSEQEEHQWQYQNNEHKRRKRDLEKSLRDEGTMTDREVGSLANICDLEISDRWRLYRYWVRRYKEAMKNMIVLYKVLYQSACTLHKLALENEERYVMGTAAIIGMTTTGAAKYRRVLADLRPKIVIVEEAAEVLEAQILTCISSACEHLILIGDHKQLQPNITVYELAERFKLKVSLFERMINNGIPCVTLETQHRMRPEISMFMKHIYPELKDSKSVKKMENVKGIHRNVFLINHSYEEDHDEELTSKSNLHEVTFIKALCWYLLQQGYKPDQITILTGYAGQVLLLKNNLGKGQFYGVRVTSIDNFQGEENDIILMSLVRSNEKKLVGFLKVDNRVCVSMSRARQGLYAIGNFDMLRKSCTLWEKIVKTAEDNRVFGSTLSLYCQNHPEDGGLEVKDYTDFAKAPEGGCTKPCKAKLNCGHQCTLKCHPYDPNHLKFICKKPCPKMTCDKNHRECQRMCCQECNMCEEPVEKRIPRCKHVQMVPCYMDPSKFSCKAPCPKMTCAMNHRQCQSLCHEKCDVCERPVEKIIPGCEHVQMVPCYLDPCRFKCNNLVYKTLPCKHAIKKMECYQEPTIFMCTKKCEAMLECGHECSGTCGECLQGKVHKACRRPYIEDMICAHIYEGFCMESKYGIQVSYDFPFNANITPEVGLCQEKCLWKCKHLKCTTKCSDPCSRRRCNFRCKRKQSCGHQCAGICGERCPSLCVVCDHEEMQKIHHQYDHHNTRFIELIACKHIFEVGTLDKYMDDAEKGFVRKIKLKACPKCQTPIKGDLRYGNVTKPIIRDIAAILQENHSQIVSHTETLEKKLLKMQGQVEKLISEIMVLSLPIFDNVNHLKHGIENLLQRMKEPSYSNQVLDEIYWECMRLQILFELIQMATRRAWLPNNVYPGMGEVLYKHAIELKQPICNTKLTPEVMKTYERILNSLKLAVRYEVPKEVLMMQFPSPKDPNCWYRCNQGHIFYEKMANPSRCPICDEVKGHIRNHGNRSRHDMSKNKNKEVEDQKMNNPWKLL